MITKGMGLKRQDVYIANILKCRPPENREPSGEEAANCLPYLERQIDIIRPEFICLLGRVAVQYLLGTTPSMGNCAASGIAIREFQPLSPIIRPISCALPAQRRYWEDLQILMNAMGLPVPWRKKGQELSI